MKTPKNSSRQRSKSANTPLAQPPASVHSASASMPDLSQPVSMPSPLASSDRTPDCPQDMDISTDSPAAGSAPSTHSLWERVQLARHSRRPLFLDYVYALFTEFDELHGDRAFADDRAILGGLARFHNRPVMVIGQHRGRSTRERIAHNFGMAHPEGYRKVIRLARLAERFQLPVLTFIDTQGAYPGVGAEERGQAIAIAQCLATFSQLRTPIIATVIGEGGSGGALAIGVADRVNMLENSIYSVISPEGCASILWKTAEKAADASEALKLGAEHLHALGIVDQIILEGTGAHDAPKAAFCALNNTLLEQLAALSLLTHEALIEARYQRLKQFDAKLTL